MKFISSALILLLLTSVLGDVGLTTNDWHWWAWLLLTLFYGGVNRFRE